jgi:hypothetical protein
MREKARQDRNYSAKPGNGLNPTEKLRGLTIHGGGEFDTSARSRT